MLKDITVGRPERVYKSIIFTTISYVVNIIPFGLSVEAARLLFMSRADGVVPTASLWWISAVLFGYMSVMYIAEIPAYRHSYRDAYDVSASGRLELAEKLRKLPLGYFSSRDPGDMVNMLMGDFALLEHGISHILPQTCGGLVLPVIAFIALSFWNFQMSLVMFISLPFALIVLILTARIQNSLSDKHMRAKIDAGSRLQEYLNGIRVIKAYNMSGERFERLESSFRTLMRESIRLEAVVGPFVILSISMIRLGLTLMIVLGVHLMLEGRLDILTFVAFLIVGTRVYDPLSQALLMFFEFRYGAIAGRRINALLEEPEMKGKAAPPERHDIELKGVTFGYGKEPVLRDISIKMGEGTLTALVGSSGCGKTTLLKLIARFYDPHEGAVLFGGRDECEMDNEKLMSKISFVFQDVYLFKDTVRNNIGFGREGATDDEIAEAARRACAHDFIMRLPQGYDTPVGEGGSTLSGGEKQRLSIVRALLKDAPVVLLDEATASLDPENELAVQSAISELVKGRTVVIIAHKLRTVEQADNIAVLDKGRIVQQGKHNELLKAGGLYAHLWSIQQRSTGWSIR